MISHPLTGVYAAVITPLNEDYSIDLPSLAPLLERLAQRGCHGALILGTTGEGPSFSPEERIALCKAALQMRQTRPDFKLLAGTGTPSLDETITLTKAAFNLGFDGVVTLPPYYFRKAGDEGLLAWFGEVIKRAVPAKGAFFGYHIPPVSGVALSLDLLARLKDAFPDRFTGLKDSSADAEHAQTLGRRFGNDLLIYSGTDSLFQAALAAGASGCITAPANLFSPDLRKVWEAHLKGGQDLAANERLQIARISCDRYPPAPSLIKGILARTEGFTQWPVRPPLTHMAPELIEKALAEFRQAGLI
jgi:4-hydroxy-tetrahydrodipicolinate synthase